MHKVTRADLAAGARRKDRPKKRKQSFNPKTSEINDASFTSTSAKKLKNQDVPEDGTLQCAVIDFILVFSTLSSFVKCSNIINENGEDKVCNGKVEFKQCAKFGLGFKILVECEKCQPRYILSCRKIGNLYEINRRFIFVMRILGLGLAGCNKFCGLMDFSWSFLNQSTYDFYINKIHECIKTIAEILFSSAAKEEKQLTSNENCIEDTTDVTVSGDDTWKKQLNMAEFEEWQKNHFEKNKCSANHQGPADSTLLLFMHGMDLKLGRNSHEYARKEDENRMLIAEKKAEAGTRDARIRHRQEQKDALDIATAVDSLLYGAGIDDSIIHESIMSYSDNDKGPLLLRGHKK